MSAIPPSKSPDYDGITRNLVDESKERGGLHRLWVWVLEFTGHTLDVAIDQLAMNINKGESAYILKHDFTLEELANAKKYKSSLQQYTGWLDAHPKAARVNELKNRIINLEKTIPLREAQEEFRHYRKLYEKRKGPPTYRENWSDTEKFLYSDQYLQTTDLGKLKEINRKAQNLLLASGIRPVKNLRIDPDL